MKERVLRIIYKHPGLRKREIASYLGIHHFKIISLLSELEDAKMVKTVYHHEPEQMEFYNTYFITDKGLEGLEL